LRDANAEPEAVAHHFTEAGLDDLAIEWWGKAGDQALRRSAFQEAIAHLGKAIAMADKTGGGKAGAESGQQQQRLHVAYGNALIQARGHGAPETTEAFARARESAFGDKDAPERLAADFGLWSGSYVRGELSVMRTHAVAFLSDVGARPDSSEAGIAHRAAGTTHWFAGEYSQARDHLERALALFQLGRDDDLAYRFAQDPGVAAMFLLAFTLWPMGDVGRAVSLVSNAKARSAGLAHIGTRAYERMHAALFALMRFDLSRAASVAAELARLAREHDLPTWRAFGVFLEGLATAESRAAGGGLDEMRRGAELLQEQNVLVHDGLFKIVLAEAEARAGDLDRAVVILDEALATCEQTGHRAFEAELHRVLGEMLLRRDPANPAPAEEALQTAIAVARQQSARAFELRAALALAILYQSTDRPADAHAVLAPALEGFSPTPEMPEIAEAQALLAALAETGDVKADAARRQQRSKLQVAYGNALFAARGFGAPETTDAFARARASASGDKEAPDRPAADFGLWAGAYTRGELSSMRAYAEAILADVQSRPDSPEAGVAHRAKGITLHFAGDYREARGHLERALTLFQPGRDDDLAFRFGPDAGVSGTAYLAFALWPIGEIGRSVSLIEQMRARMASLTQSNTLAMGHMYASQFALMRCGREYGKESNLELARIAIERDLAQFRAFGEFFKGWATAESDPLGGLEAMRRGSEMLTAQNVLVFDGLIKIALAEAEAGAGDPDRGVAILDEALATADRTGYRSFEAELHRARGEMLLKLKHDPSNTASAEEALQTATVVAKQQGTRSFELRAALSLAKLYQSTGRPADARAVLAPALEGFSPTPEMPEIAEAQALMAALEQTEEVKADAAKQQRLTHLHVAYGNALIAARGHGARETTEAFARARKSASGDEGAPERLAADYGLWVGSYVRGDLPSMRTHAAAFLAGVQATPNSPEAGVAHRVLGTTHCFAGEYAEAREHLERALALFQPGRDDDLAFRFGQDAGVAAMCYLALASWPLGNVRRAVSLIDETHGRLAGVAHIGTHPYAKLHAATFELMRGDRARAAENGSEAARLAREHDLPLWRAYGAFFEGLATAERGALGEGLNDMRRSAESLRQQDLLNFDGLFKIALAEAEARAGDRNRAIAILDEALTTADRLGYRAFEAELNRTRGEILLECDPANSAPAEEAFQTAIALAKRQGTRSFELRAALSLAKLYQSIGRPAAAHAVLAPALEGLSLTSEMPEIAEAQALLAG
jgi:predicted ATPase